MPVLTPRSLRLTPALLVAAALAGDPGTSPPPPPDPPAQATAPASAPAAPPLARDAEAASDPNALLIVPLKLLEVLDLDFSLGPWTFRGYLQFDGADYHQAAAGPPETDFRRGAIGSGDTLDAQALADGSYLRKARLGGEGQIGDNIAYRAMFDIGGRDELGESRIAEVWVRYSRAPYAVIVGAYPQLASMEDATSTDANPFLERATAANLARGLGGGDGRLGVTLRRATRHWMTAISLTGPVLHDDDHSSRAAVVARASRAFYRPNDTSFHVGGSLIQVLTPGKSPEGGPGRIGFRLIAAPEVRVDDTSLLDTGEILAERARVVGLEFAARRRNLFLQAEAFHFAVERASAAGDAGDPRFFGFYVEGSWILSGETRRFDRTRAVFGRLKTRNPLRQGGWGAWELAFRYSRMDANSHAGDAGAPPPPGGVRGGDQRILALALNWYPSDRIRIMLNGMRVRVDRLNPASPADPEPFGPAPVTPPVGVQIGQTLDVLALRFRYAF